jgi:hypothetical protein
MTVAVSIASGVAAITSAYLSMQPATVWIGVGVIVILLAVNLRGVSQAGGYVRRTDVRLHRSDRRPLATGIISTGTFLLGPSWLSRALLGAASAGPVVLGAALTARLVFFHSSVAADIKAPDRVFGFFTITAGPGSRCVLTSRSRLGHLLRLDVRLQARPGPPARFARRIRCWPAVRLAGPRGAVRPARPARAVRLSASSGSVAGVALARARLPGWPSGSARHPARVRAAVARVRRRRWRPGAGGRGRVRRPGDLLRTRATIRLPPSEARTPRLVTSAGSGAVIWRTSVPARPQTASLATSVTTASPSAPGLRTGSARCTSNRS